MRHDRPARAPRPILTCGLLAALLAAGAFSWDIADPIGIALFGEWVELDRAVVVGHTYLRERTAIAMAIELICAFLFLSIARRALPRVDPTIRIRAAETFAVLFLLSASCVENLTILPAYPAIAVGTIGGIAFYAWAMLRVLSTRSALRTVHRHLSRMAWVVVWGCVGIIGSHIVGVLLIASMPLFVLPYAVPASALHFPEGGFYRVIHADYSITIVPEDELNVRLFGPLHPGYPFASGASLVVT